MRESYGGGVTPDKGELDGGLNLQRIAGGLIIHYGSLPTHSQSHEQNQKGLSSCTPSNRASSGTSRFHSNLWFQGAIGVRWSLLGRDNVLPRNWVIVRG